MILRAFWSDFKMSLESESESEKIRKIKRRLKRLHTTYDDMIDKFKYFQAELKDHERLSHRKECPLCRQKIDSEIYMKQIPELKRNIEIIEAWIVQNYNYFKLGKIRRHISILEVKRIKEEKREVEAYLKKNRNVINKTIRTFELPEIKEIEEKKLWNEAIELQLDNKGMPENDDLLFEISN